MSHFSISNHCYERARERMGLNPKQTNSVVEKAIKCGLRWGDCKFARDRNYLRDLELQNHVAIAYENFCFVISEDMTVITVFPLPKDFGRKGSYFGKNRINNRTYQRAKEYYKYDFAG